MADRPSLRTVIFCAALFLALAEQGARAQAPAPASPPAPAESQPGAAGPETRPGEPPSPSPAEIPAVVIDGRAAGALLGKPVQSVKNEDLGRVVDVVIDRNGVLRAAVIDFGGFLGVGTRKIAVDWRALHFPDKGGMDKLIADLPREVLKSAPAYKEGEPIVVIGAPPPPPENKPPEQKP